MNGFTGAGRCEDCKIIAAEFLPGAPFQRAFLYWRSIAFGFCRRELLCTLKLTAQLWPKLRQIICL